MDTEDFLIDEDGWNKDHLEDIGMMNFISTVDTIWYDLQNCVRGAHGVSGNTADDLLNDLYELKDLLENVICEVEDNIRK